MTEAENKKKSCRYLPRRKKLHEALEENSTALHENEKETDNITGILISAVGEKKRSFSHYGKRLHRLRGKKGNKRISCWNTLLRRIKYCKTKETLLWRTTENLQHSLRMPPRVKNWSGSFMDCNGDFACGTFCAGISAEIPDKNGKGDL